MRIAAFLFALCAAGAAFAQDPAPGFGPYRFGMTPEEARAAAPGEWRALNAEPSSVMTFLGPNMRIGDLSPFSLLEFTENRLTSIVLNSGSIANNQQRCHEGVDHLLGHLARFGGPFTGERIVTEIHGDATDVVAPDGSLVRRYRGADGLFHSFANRAGAAFVQLEARYGRLPEYDRAWSCVVIITVAPQAIPTQAALNANAPTLTELEAAPRIERVDWLERPTGQVFARHYPQAALMASIGGRVDLDCLVNAEGYLRCVVSSEEPLEHGFGPAALAISRSFRMVDQTRDGGPTNGARIRIPIRFNVGQR